FTLPDSSKTGSISVATTCTALMALIFSDHLDALYSRKWPALVAVATSKKKSTSKGKPNPSPKDVFGDLVRADWASSGLDDLNAFTSSMVVRAAGSVVDAGLLTTSEVAKLKHKKTTLKDVVSEIAKNSPDRFAVPGYPAKTAMAYWYVDGITRAKL